MSRTIFHSPLNDLASYPQERTDRGAIRSMAITAAALHFQLGMGVPLQHPLVDVTG